jgi:tripartite-type tricarboxylate transporter receptor subunit TctC
VALLFDSIVTAQAHMKTGIVKALAISSPARTPLLPELPTMIEAGVPGFESETWFGLFAPAGTPADIVSRVSTDTAAALAAADVRARFAAAGAETVGGTPAQLAARVKSDAAKWAGVIKAANVKVQ